MLGVLSDRRHYAPRQGDEKRLKAVSENIHNPLDEFHMMLFVFGDLAKTFAHAVALFVSVLRIWLLPFSALYPSSYIGAMQPLLNRSIINEASERPVLSDRFEDVFDDVFSTDDASEFAL